MKVQLKLVSVISLFIQLLAVGLSTPSQAATDVTIAYQGPITGAESPIGIAELNGAKYAVSKFNATSTKYKVQLTTIDDQGDPAIAARVVPSALKNKDISLMTFLLRTIVKSFQLFVKYKLCSRQNTKYMPIFS